MAGDSMEAWASTAVVAFIAADTTHSQETGWDLVKRFPILFPGLKEALA